MSTSMPGSITIEFDLAVFRLTAIKKAAYRLGDRCYAQINREGPMHATVTLRPKRSLDRADVLAGEFQQEVLDQELREVVAAETEGVRNLLLAQAFSATSLVQPLSDTADFRRDPLGVHRSDARLTHSSNSLPDPQ